MPSASLWLLGHPETTIPSPSCLSAHSVINLENFGLFSSYFQTGPFLLAVPSAWNTLPRSHPFLAVPAQCSKPLVYREQKPLHF